MKKNELIRKMKSLETNVALTTSSFLIAIDESINLETRKLFTNEYLGQIDTLLELKVYPKEISELYLEGKKYLQNLVKNDFK